MKKGVNWKVLIFSLIIVYSIALLGSAFTTPNTEWYESIKPTITPPNWVFPIVWNILFFMIGLSIYFSWTSAKNTSAKKSIAGLFGMNLFFNLIWSYIFFTLQNPANAFIDLILIWLSIIPLFILTKRVNKIAMYLLIPYFLWVSFAGILNWLML